MNKIINKIFSISEFDNTHRLIKIFGIKIKYPKKEFRVKRNQNPYYYYKKNNIDIRTIPPAQGQIREIQLANLELLKELDYVCKKNNLRYWIDFGTLLGAVRHKGFIPWDDDIDTGMPRDDYNKLIEAFNSSTRNPDIVVRYYKNDERNSATSFIKIYHKKCPHLFVDIFPYDFYGEKLSKNAQLIETNRIKQERKNLENECTPGMSIEEILEKISKYREKILKNNTENENSDLVWGFDYGHRWKNWFTPYNTVFPLKEILFESEKFPCMNDTENFLKEVYGDYLAYPQKIGMGHAMYIDVPQKEAAVIKDLIKK